MAIDVTKTDNYTALSGANQTLVDTAVTAVKAAFAGTAATEQKDNVYMILKEQNESQEES